MKHWHPMMGIDFHIPWPPGSPSPAPSPVPYRTGMVLIGTSMIASYAPTHLSMGYGMSMQQGTDIGFLIPHIGPPSVLLAIEIPLSSSKSYFGVARYPAEGKPICVAMSLMVNMNLNCGTPVPTPTGMVLALNTHMVSMSLADMIYGSVHMLLDFGLQSLLQWAGGKAGGLIAARFEMQIAYLTYRFGPQLLSKAAAKAFLRSSGRSIKGRDINRVAREFADAHNARVQTGRNAVPSITSELAGNITGWFTGGPMGADNATIGGPTLVDEVSVGGTPVGNIPTSMAQGAADYVNEPSVPEHPSSPPASSTPDAGPPAPDAGPPAPDAGAGTPDAGTPDAGTPDAGTPDAGGADDGGPNASYPPDDGGVCGPDNPGPYE
ncbi:hypothetical protein [Stieleria mannarensis]|uniref:hypothetical protein n=1 Tax=Stieleria mannarensis TaxID=2755585 RepID=UPI0016019644|nr:hypothetical protein [Rhodopirellula sp. JC639]